MYNAIVLFQNNPHNETNMVATVCMVTHTHVHACIVPGLLIIKHIHLTQHSMEVCCVPKTAACDHVILYILSIVHQ